LEILGLKRRGSSKILDVYGNSDCGCDIGTYGERSGKILELYEIKDWRCDIGTYGIGSSKIL